MTWMLAGLVIPLQIVPLDMTACEIWFYFSTAGVLGMIGVLLMHFQAKLNVTWFLFIVVLLMCALGARTIARSTDWNSQDKLAIHNIHAGSHDYSAFNILAIDLAKNGDFQGAWPYAITSVRMFPTGSNYLTLANIESNLGHYSQAWHSYKKAFDYTHDPLAAQNLGMLALIYGNANTNEQLLQNMVVAFPRNGSLWLDLAIFEEAQGNNDAAKTALEKAMEFIQVSQTIYTGIMAHQPFGVNVDSRFLKIQ
jgi:tetratricopeptide (TPR) repeat protein